jgi:hypothetical protein
MFWPAQKGPTSAGLGYENTLGYRRLLLIDESVAKILLNGGGASDTNVFPVRGRYGSLEGRYIPSVTNWNLVLLASGSIRAGRPEHVSAEGPSAHVQEAPSEDVGVDPGRSSVAYRE